MKNKRTMVYIEEDNKRKGKIKAMLLGFTFEEYINRLIDVNTQDVFLPKKGSKFEVKKIE